MMFTETEHLFLFPLQSLLKRIIEAPMKFIIRKNRPENRKDVGVVIFLYTIIFIGLSLFWVDLSPIENIQVRSTKEEYSQVKVDSLLTEITKIQPRRYRSLQPYNELILMGNKAHTSINKVNQRS